MTHKLATLLGSDHPLFSHNLAQLEKAAGGDSIDTKLIADITEKGHAVLRQLGLDTADTSASELYGALNAQVSSGRVETLLSDTSYVLLELGGLVVSLNAFDVIENAHHELSFDQRKTDHAKRHLRAEIIKRYAEADRTSGTMVHELAEQAGLKPSQDEDYKQIDIVTWQSGAGNSPRMLMIGDIFTDAFIKLDETYAKVEKDSDGQEWLKVPFGSKPPYERVDIVRSVGPSPNAAVSVSRLGLDVSLMAWLGDDEPGRESLKHLASEGVDVVDMVTQPHSKSSYWYVLRHGSDRTMLVKSEEYDYTWREPNKKPDWIYLAYIGADSWPLHEGLLGYLEAHPEIQFVFQPATYHFEWGTERLAGLYKRANLVVMNREEAMQVTSKPHEDLKSLADGLHQLGPKNVVITDGPHGSYASYDGKLITIPNYPDPAPPVDRTGAGDAFASTLTAALALGKDMEEALTWAPINSMSVVQEIGAQKGLLSRDAIADWLQKAPDDYRITNV